MLSIPVIGTWVYYLVFGGDFPGTEIIGRLYIAHVLLIPGLLLALIGAHMLLLVFHKHTQWAGPGRTEKNVVGYPMLPVYMAKAGGFFFMVFGVTALMGALLSINPIWKYGPYDPSKVTAGSQPDWYMGFTEGALRLMPGFPEYHVFGYTLSLNVFIPGVILLGALFTIAGAYPFIESWVTKDKSEHHILDRPRNAPTRTGLGVMAISFYMVLFLAGGNDLIATHFHLSINDITNTFQVLLIAVPPIAYSVTKRVCLGLQRRDRDLILHGRETGRIVRLPHGEFIEVHEPLEEHEAWRLVAPEPIPAIELPPEEDENGVRRKGAAKERLRAKLSRFYFDDRIEPVTPAELAAAQAHGHGHSEVGPGEVGHDEHGPAITSGH
jgi:ubiquinol-cytochrome c reductase cytochrome b subunit